METWQTRLSFETVSTWSALPRPSPPLSTLCGLLQQIVVLPRAEES